MDCARELGKKVHFIPGFEDEILFDHIFILVHCSEIEHFFGFEMGNLRLHVVCVNYQKIQPNVFPVVGVIAHDRVLLGSQIRELGAPIDLQEFFIQANIFEVLVVDEA